MYSEKEHGVQAGIGQMMKSFLINIIGITCCWYFIDIESKSVFPGVIAPVGFIVFLISLLIWVVLFFQRRGIIQTTSHAGDGSNFGGFGDGGGDC